ncbi:MAG: alpha-L-glutamate ligase-like protein [Xanthomonadales bacterium]|nr:alpha-L-glutamate ligase-like protein [Xanthomonadales bacterium]
MVSPGRLREAGILGMNHRNVDLISRLNPRRLYPLVDNKLKTKIALAAAGIAAPRLIGTLRTQHDIADFADLVGPLDGFAIKPARGSGGKGILVIVRRRGDNFIRASGTEVDLDTLEFHVSNILSGLFSLGGTPDVAFVEDLVRPDPLFRDLSVEGVPDIRVIVYRGFPIMAMLRLATRASAGKANLHQGAVGVGLRMADGQAIRAVQFSKNLESHPDSGAPLKCIAIPEWDRILTLATRCADVTGLGYLGADIVLDRQRGPLVLELNARPGLAIQMTNRAGMLPRIAAIDALDAADFRRPPEQRTEIVRRLFSASAPPHV